MIIETVLGGIAIIMFLLSKLGLPFSSMLVIVSLTAFSMYYFPLGFWAFSDKSVSKSPVGISIVAGILLSFAPVAVLFYLMGWPSAKAMVIAAGAISSIMAIASISIRTPETWKYYERMFARSITLTIVCGVALVRYFL